MLTSHKLAITPSVADEPARRPPDVGMRRNLPGGLVRDSVTVHRRLLAPRSLASPCACAPRIEHVLRQPGGSEAPALLVTVFVGIVIALTCVPSRHYGAGVAV